MTLAKSSPSSPALLVWHDGEGGRYLGLAPPPGQAGPPKPLFRLLSQPAHLLALALVFGGPEQPQRIPVELVANEAGGRVIP